MNLRDLISSGRSSLGDLDALLRRMGTPDQAMVGVDVARGVVPGRPEPALAEMDPETLALMDRMAWGQQNREHYGVIPSALTGVATVAPYEAVKAAAQSSNPLVSAAGRGLMGGVGSLFNLMGGKGDEMAPAANTSPASIANVLAYMYGAGGRR